MFVAGAMAAHAGDITGVVMDKELNEPLMGASIRIAGTRLGTTADIDGKFRLRNLKKGTYTIEVSYVSFFPPKMTLQVPATGEVSVTVEMTTDDKQLNEVTVTARKNLELGAPCWPNARRPCCPLRTLARAKCPSKAFPTCRKE